MLDEPEEMLANILAITYEECQGTHSFAEYISLGWTSEVFQLLFLDKVNNETLSVSWKTKSWVGGYISSS